MPFRIQGSSASLAPFRQTWRDIVMGTDLRGAPFLSAFKDCQLDFDACTYASYQQWSQFANTGQSMVTATVLNLDGTSFTAFSGVYMRIDNRPTFESGNVGVWTAIITRCAF